ncbi:MAG: PIN domain-containing protein, partial [bacterium]|nr:PIN domain-containing protein [bacterium]
NKISISNLSASLMWLPFLFSLFSIFCLFIWRYSISPSVRFQTGIQVLAGLKPGEEEKTEGFLNSLGVIPIDREIAEVAGELSREQKNKNGQAGFSDTIIAATCLVGRFILITYNKKHYRAFKGLEMYSE